MILTPYLLFDGHCAQAMEFYRSCFDGKLTLTTVGDSPMKQYMPPEMHLRVLNARLKNEIVDISASDWLLPSQTPVRGNTVCLYLSGETADELHGIFEKLSRGAHVTDPLEKKPFGTYGALNDEFGVRWMFHAP